MTSLVLLACGKASAIIYLQLQICSNISLNWLQEGSSPLCPSQSTSERFCWLRYILQWTVFFKWFVHFWEVCLEGMLSLETRKLWRSQKAVFTNLKGGFSFKAELRQQRGQWIFHQCRTGLPVGDYLEVRSSRCPSEHWIPACLCHLNLRWCTC